MHKVTAWIHCHRGTEHPKNVFYELSILLFKISSVSLYLRVTVA
jgi:hypothetical protein